MATSQWTFEAVQAANGTVKCSWPLQVISQSRQLDLTQCFENLVLIPVPLLLTLLTATAQLVSKRRKLRRGDLLWSTRNPSSEKVNKIKGASLSFAALLAFIALVLAVVSFEPASIVKYGLYTLTLVGLAHLSSLNHHTSRQSSTLILLFWPIFTLIAVVRLRTMILTGRLQSRPIVVARESLWIASIGIGLIDFGLELYAPEKRWRFKSWSKYGKIALEEDEEADTIQGLNGSVPYDEVESPVLTANIYERLSFSWLTPLLSLGTRKFLGEEDMWSLPPTDSAEALSNRLAQTWKQQEDLVAQGKKKKPSLKIAIAKAYGWPYFIAGLLKAAYDCLSFAQPQLLRLLLAYVSSYASPNPMPPVAGYAVSIAMFVAAVAATATMHQYFDRCFTTTMRVKGGLVTLIYRKSLVLSNGEKSGRTTGDIVNLQSVDAVRIADLAQYGHIAWSGPFQIILAFISLYQIVGWQAFVGVAVMFISLPVSTGLARIMKRYQRKMMKIKDTRTRTMNEILNNIKSIKLYGWEKVFSQKILEVRNQEELKMLRNIGLVHCASAFSFTSTPFFVAFVTFASFAATSDRPLTSDIIFPAIALFQLLSFPMAVFANIINSIIEALVSVNRLEDFLAADELDPNARTVILSENDPKGEAVKGDVVVSIHEGEFRWIANSPEPILQDIDLKVKKGELLAVIGRVGDGKSSLLGAILGEMTKSSGSVTVRGQIAYFSQSSWILSATVKDNIVFGHRFDQEFYDKVLDACALRADLAVLPSGDQTEVGEKGVSLSGGQKARICLARACYARADIYLLDDPLSAVDAHVGRHIFDHVIGPRGLLKNKARILCTNAVNFLPQTDSVLMLRRGIILERATYSDAMGNHESELYKLITGLGKQSSKSTDPSTAPTPAISTPTDTDDDEKVEGEKAVSARRRRRSTLRRASAVSITQAKRDALRDLRESAKPKEHSEKGQVKRDVYKAYLSAASTPGFILFVFGTIGGQGFGILANYVLKYWAAHADDPPAKYLVPYFFIGISSSICLIGGFLVLRVFCSLRSSRVLHDGAFSALMRSPLSFFELTPTGRILNLFSRDIFVIDEVVINAIGAFTRTLASVLGVIAVVALNVPPVLLVFIPLGYIYLLVMRYYLATSRELKRLDAVSRSPIFSFFGETLAGLPVIRGFSQSKRFIANNEARVDRNQQCYVPAMTINRWLGCRLEFLGTCLMFSSALASVTALLLSRNIDAGMVGMLMTYTISVTGSLNWLVRSASEVEQNIVSVERVLGYANLPPEAANEIPETQPSASWPEHGEIHFQDYCMRYRPDLELCLKDVTFTIKGGDRVGVCGRTGAGKSSLTLALFRILEAAGGKILIDGVDISTIGLHDLRSVVSIIPQDPQLFEGTLRANIDPAGNASDADIWQALAQAHLKDHVTNTMGGTLDAEIAEGGSNLSSGQRQLVCFARALLRKTKILVLDEATSSIDLETDEAVQTILRGTDFRGVTTITIAHRLNTILDSDKVLVMDQGRVAEYDSPANLLADEKSVFHSLANEAGLGDVQ